jgi:hypothetical protein
MKKHKECHRIIELEMFYSDNSYISTAFSTNEMINTLGLRDIEQTIF